MSANTSQPVGVSTSGRGEITLPQIVGFFRRNALLIGGAAVAAGALTVASILLFVPRSFEASATLVVVPSAFSSELKPATLTVQAYQKLLESDAVVLEARERLVRQGVLQDSDHLRMGRELESRIFVSRRAEETTLAPMLQAVARGRTAERAAQIANTWAEVFLERTRDLVVGNATAAVRFVEKQFPEARASLALLEEQRVAAADSYQQRMDDSSSVWEKRITAFENETAMLVAEKQGGTALLLAKLKGELNLNTRDAQLSSLRNAYSELQDEQARIYSQLDQRRLELAASRRQLAATPQLLTLQKAISDDALWQRVATGEKPETDWKALQSRSLQSQEVNPLYTEVATRVVELETQVDALAPRAAEMEAKLAQMSQALNALEVSVGADQAAVEKLTLEKEAELVALRAERERAAGELSRGRQAEQEAIQREREAKLAQLDRNIQQQSDLYSQLAKSYNQAVLAKAQQEIEDVRLAAGAVSPEQPRSRGTAAKGLLAVIVGGMLGTLVALVREGSA